MQFGEALGGGPVERPTLLHSASDWLVLFVHIVTQIFPDIDI